MLRTARHYFAIYLGYAVETSERFVANMRPINTSNMSITNQHILSFVGYADDRRVCILRLGKRAPRKALREVPTTQPSTSFCRDPLRGPPRPSSRGWMVKPYPRFDSRPRSRFSRLETTAERQMVSVERDLTSRYRSGSQGSHW